MVLKDVIGVVLDLLIAIQELIVLNLPQFFFLLLVFFLFGIGTFFSDLNNDSLSGTSYNRSFKEQSCKDNISESLLESGTVRLQKGVATVNLTSVNENAVIILSRKTIKGTPGTELIVDDIENSPNASFTITSMKDGEYNTKDSGLVCWVKVN